ncbi:MAG: TolC family protein [Alphaproteobacteria bacterium]|nr:TolC family protein [Alphaproteobacteria bacterium]
MKTKTFYSLGILAGLLAAVSLLPAFPAYAQEAKPAQLGTEALITQPIEKTVLTLDQAINRALQQSPSLGASSARVSAASASRSAAGVLPNPSLSVEAENIYGDGAYDGLDSAEMTYGVSQLIEMPGKRSGRIRIADAEKDSAHLTSDGVTLNLIRDVTVAFAEVAAAQQEVSVLEEQQDLATKVRNSVAAKVQAGKEPHIQKNKAEIELSSSKISLDRAYRNLAAKKQMLSSLMGGDVRDFSASIESLPEPKQPEAIEKYREYLDKTPDFMNLQASIERAKAGLSLEKANAVPDPTLNVGIRDFRGDNAQAFIVGLSIPIPVFNMNRAGIERAGHDVTAAALDEQNARLNLEAALTELHANYSNAYSEVTALKSSVLPGAEEAFRFAQDGYEAGKFNYLEVLDAQRTLFDTRKQLNEVSLDYYRQRAALERIAAIHDDIQSHAHKENIPTKEHKNEQTKN